MKGIPKFSYVRSLYIVSCVCGKEQGPGPDPLAFAWVLSSSLHWGVGWRDMFRASLLRPRDLLIHEAGAASLKPASQDGRAIPRSPAPLRSRWRPTASPSQRRGSCPAVRTLPTLRIQFSGPSGCQSGETTWRQSTSWATPTNLELVFSLVCVLITEATASFFETK